MSGKEIRWGILGCGKIAKKFASDLRLVENATLQSVASRNIDNASQFAVEYNAKHYYGNYEQLVSDNEVDVIYVATPHGMHCEHTILCLENKKAVLCEKAFAINAKQVNEMIAVAKRQNVFLMEALWSKFLPHYQKMNEIIKSGKLGKINSVLINFGFKPKEPIAQRIYDPSLGGGTLLDIGIYNVFYALSILGKPDEIHASIVPFNTGVDDECAVTFKYNNGSMAQLFSTFRSSLPTEAEIAGTLGSLKLTNRFYEPTAKIEFYADAFKERQEMHIVKPEGFGYQFEAQHVTECLQKDLKESPVMTFSDSLLLIEILDQIRKVAGIVYPVDK
ncbi:MAG: Gfo/Idh/MocA family oxidoreductase [Ginsengibacter sp.]